MTSFLGENIYFRPHDMCWKLEDILVSSQRDTIDGYNGQIEQKTASAQWDVQLASFALEAGLMVGVVGVVHILFTPTYTKC